MMIRNCSANVINKFADVQNKRTAQTRQIIPLDEVGREVICSVMPNYMYVEVSGLHGDQFDQKLSQLYERPVLRGNDNGDYFAWNETLLKKEAKYGMYAFDTWRGKDNLLNHNETKVVGDIPDVWPVLKDKSINMLVRTCTKRAWDVCESVRLGKVDSVSMGCFLPATRVTMANGTFKHIEDIFSGEEVLTAYGRTRKVNATQVLPKDEKIVSIHVNGYHENIYSTRSHPHLVIAKDSSGILRGKSREAYASGSLDLEPFLDCTDLKDCIQWKHAENVNNGDLMLQPVNMNVAETVVTTNKNLAIIIGMFLSEGHLLYPHNEKKEYKADPPYGVQFSLNNSERDMKTLAALKLALADEGVSSIKDQPFTSGSNGYEFFAYDKRIASICKDACGETAKLKRLSQAIMLAPIEWQKTMLGYYIEGDGGAYKGSLYSSTASVQLAWQLRQLCARIGLAASVNKNDHKADSKSSVVKKDTIEYQVWIGTNFSYRLAPYLTSLETRRSVHRDNRRMLVRFGENYYVASSVSEVSKIDYCGNVYNIEVDEDYSYCVEHLATHNTIVNHSFCGACGNKAETEDSWCDCLKKHKGSLMHPDMLKTAKLRDKWKHGVWACEDNRGVFGIEVSWITVGAAADPDAKVINILAGMKGPVGNQFNNAKKANYSKIADAFYEKISKK